MGATEEILFKSGTYKEYLLAVEASKLVTAKGFRSKLAQAAGCNSPFVSHVLNGGADFSLEQAFKLHHLLGHEDEEARFFLLLVQKDRAGTPELKQFYQAQITAVLEARSVIKNRLKVKEKLSLEDKVRYYSSWEYGAAHVFLTLPTCQTLEALEKKLGISRARTLQVLNNLVKMGLVEQRQHRYLVTDARIHIGSDSELVAQHHTNWRLRALQSLSAKSADDLHYSSSITVSQADAKKLRAMMADFIASATKVIDPSPAEEAFSFCLDFYHL